MFLAGVPVSLKSRRGFPSESAFTWKTRKLESRFAVNGDESINRVNGMDTGEETSATVASRRAERWRERASIARSSRESSRLIRQAAAFSRAVVPFHLQAYARLLGITGGISRGTRKKIKQTSRRERRDATGGRDCNVFGLDSRLIRNNLRSSLGLRASREGEIENGIAPSGEKPVLF